MQYSVCLMYARSPACMHVELLLRVMARYVVVSVAGTHAAAEDRLTKHALVIASWCRQERKRRIVYVSSSSLLSMYNSCKCRGQLAFHRPTAGATTHTHACVDHKKWPNDCTRTMQSSKHYSVVKSAHTHTHRKQYMCIYVKALHAMVKIDKYVYTNVCMYLFFCLCICNDSEANVVGQGINIH